MELETKTEIYQDRKHEPRKESEVIEVVRVADYQESDAMRCGAIVEGKKITIYADSNKRAYLSQSEAIFGNLTYSTLRPPVVVLYCNSEYLRGYLVDDLVEYKPTNMNSLALDCLAIVKHAYGRLPVIYMSVGTYKDEIKFAFGCVHVRGLDQELERVKSAGFTIAATTTRELDYDKKIGVVMYELRNTVIKHGALLEAGGIAMTNFNLMEYI